jgi:hypothetical protein
MGKPNWLEMDRVPCLHTPVKTPGRAALRNKVAMMCVWGSSSSRELQVAPCRQVTSSRGWIHPAGAQLDFLHDTSGFAPPH